MPNRAAAGGPVRHLHYGARRLRLRLLRLRDLRRRDIGSTVSGRPVVVEPDLKDSVGLAINGVDRVIVNIRRAARASASVGFRPFVIYDPHWTTFYVVEPLAIGKRNIAVADPWRTVYSRLPERSDAIGGSYPYRAAT